MHISPVFSCSVTNLLSTYISNHLLIDDDVVIILDVLLIQGKVIPKAAVSQWKSLGTALGIQGDDLDIIEKNIVKDDVVTSTKRMLRQWVQQRGLGGSSTKVLIKAIDSVGLVNAARILERGWFLLN